MIAAFEPADLEPISDTVEGDTPALRDFGPLAGVRAKLNPPFSPASAVEALASVVTAEDNGQRIRSILYIADA